MSSLLKNKTFAIAVVAVIVVLLLGIGGFMFVNHNLSQGQSDDQTQNFEDAIKLSPSDIGLQMIASSNKKQVKFVINKPQGFTKVEYELSYMANSTGTASEDEGEGDMPAKINRGVAGDDQISPDESKYESKFLDLGSCSSGTCRYDTGVDSVHLLLKLTKSDGKLYQVEDDLKL